MKNFLFTIAFIVAAVIVNAQQQPGDTSRPRRFRPVIGELSTNPGVHDPVMAKEGDTFYVFHTGSGVWSSKDMITWKRERPVFDSSNTPSWLRAAGFSRPGYWAPDIWYHNGQWYLYYSNSAFGKNTSAIGVATNKTLNPSSPDYKWVDRGKIVQTYPGKTNYNAIDPSVIYDKKTKSPWMVYGSFWHGMQLVKLTKDGLRLANPDDSITLHTIASRMTDPSAPNPPSDGVHPADAGGNAIEAPFLFQKGKYYYLFVSWDYCCSGNKSDYKIAVGRSKKIEGPYLDKNGVDMARGGGTVIQSGDMKEFFAVGHNSAYTFDNTDYIVYHGYSVAENAASKLVIEKLEWDKDGWPIIGERITPKPAVILSYDSANAQKKTSAPKQFNYKVDLRKAGTSAEKIAALDSVLQSFVDEKKVANVAAFVAKGGDVVYKKSFGWKDMEKRIPASPEDYYILFSQTKAITTVAFMTLVEKGLVKIDDPVSKYFPEISDQVVTAVRSDGTYETRPVSTPMTFIHLMSHSSGLNAGLVGNIRRMERQRADSIRRANGDTSKPGFAGQRSGSVGNARYLKDDMIALAKYPLGFDPGSEWNYHISTNMLAYMIERISGKSLRQYVKETVLQPLGMDNTDWYYAPEALARFVKAYNYADGKLEAASNNFSEGTTSKVQTYFEGAIGLNGPIEDYAKFCQMLLNRGEFNGHRILKPETIDLMTKINRLPEVNSGGKGFQFGLGFELYNQNKKPVPEVSNTAFAWGGLFGTEYIIDPENNMIVLFYLNMPRRETLYPKFLSKAYQLFTR